MKISHTKATLVSQIKNVEGASDGDLIIEGYANTVTKDRAGDVIPASAWRTNNALNNYLKNPIILAYHNHSKPIGKMISHEVTELGLKIIAKISKGAGDVYHLIKDGILSTFSVGFAILDAEYDSKSDTYYINDVELQEVSVVSVPCNQDSTFSVAKSMEQSEFNNFEKQFTIKNKEIFTMTEFEKLQKMIADQADAATKAATDAATKAINDAEAAKAKATQDALDAQAKVDAEKSIKEASDKASKAEQLVSSLETKLNESAEVFSKAVLAKEEEIKALRDEVAQVVAARTAPSVASSVKTALSPESKKDVDAVVMLGLIKKAPMFDTDFGKAHQKAVNASSSIQVSSDAYETEFSTNLMRDIQAALVVAPLFTEITMTSANLTIPINPDRGNATWVDAANYGTDASSGAEITVALTEKTLKTFKLAAKTFLTEETSEDAIIPLLPILRQHLVEAHAAEIDLSFLRGDGTGKPKGLVTQANAASATQVTTATSNGAVKVTAKEILKARRKLGLYGVNLGEVALVVSQDAYWDLLEDDEWGDVQQVSTSSVKLRGEVGNIYGMPVIVSNHFAAKAASTAFAVMVNKTNFLVARQRGVTVRSDFDVEKDRRVFVATQRLNLEPLIEASAGNGKGVVEITYAA